MHDFDADNEALVRAVINHALERMTDEPPMQSAKSADELRDLVGQTVTAEGLGGTEALRREVEHLAPSNIAADNPR